MSTDVEVLKLLLSRENYDQYRRYIKVEETIQVVRDLIKALDGLVESDKKLTDITPSALASYFFLAVRPDIKRNEKQMYEEVINKLSEPTEVQPEVLLTKFKRLVTNDKLIQLATVNAPFEDIKKVIEEHDKSTVSKDESELLDWDILDMDRVVSATDGVTWSLPCLNEWIGPYGKGQFGLVAARPGVGKTSFLIDQVSTFLKQLAKDECILWFNNENLGRRIQQRFLVRCLQKPWEELSQNKDKLLRAIKKYGFDRVKFIDAHSYKHKDIERILRQHNPKLAIIDVLDNLRGFEKVQGASDAPLGALYKWALDTSCDVCPIIGTSQLNNECDGRPYPALNNLKGSTTAKQGYISWVIMLGTNERHTDATPIRYVSTPRNKYGKGYLKRQLNFDRIYSKYTE